MGPQIRWGGWPLRDVLVAEAGVAVKETEARRWASQFIVRSLRVSRWLSLAAYNVVEKLGKGGGIGSYGQGEACKSS